MTARKTATDDGEPEEERGVEPPTGDGPPAGEAPAASPGTAVGRGGDSGGGPAASGGAAGRGPVADESASRGGPVAEDEPVSCRGRGGVCDPVGERGSADGRGAGGHDAGGRGVGEAGTAGGGADPAADRAERLGGRDAALGRSALLEPGRRGAAPGTDADPPARAPVPLIGTGEGSGGGAGRRHGAGRRDGAGCRDGAAEPEPEPAPRGAANPIEPEKSSNADRIAREIPAGRDPYFDNAKFLAVALVVVGHAWEPLRGAAVGGRILGAGQSFIYAFHLPVFIVMCGYFSRGFSRSRNRTRKLVAAIVAPYVLFSAVYVVYTEFLAGRHMRWDPLEPYYLTWFLPALLAWRLSVPLWQQLRFPIAIGLAVAIWLFAGLVTLPSMLDAVQVLSFLPFFVLGLILGPRHFALLRRPAVRVAGALTLVAGAVAAYALENSVDPEWVHWRRSFAELGVGAPSGVGFRVLALGAAALLTAAFLAVVPARRTWFSRLGAASMYAYLLHGFVTLFLSYQGWYYRISGWQVPALTAGCVLLAVALMTDPVRKVFRWAVEPRLEWLFR
jgi:fucose 4-O-acetylase-like acetyltransferase